MLKKLSLSLLVCGAIANLQAVEIPVVDLKATSVSETLKEEESKALDSVQNLASNAAAAAKDGVNQATQNEQIEKVAGSFLPKSWGGGVSAILGRSDREPVQWSVNGQSLSSLKNSAYDWAVSAKANMQQGLSNSKNAILNTAKSGKNAVVSTASGAVKYVSDLKDTVAQKYFTDEAVARGSKLAGAGALALCGLGCMKYTIGKFKSKEKGFVSFFEKLISGGLSVGCLVAAFKLADLDLNVFKAS